ncbi:MAG: DUF3800 domain-containing protein [Methyloligellaceae bacterium]
MIAEQKKYILYIDDTGSRDLHKSPIKKRNDNVDCFGLGGILVKGEDDTEIYHAHRSFCGNWGINYPLHSSSIRGHRGDFGWLSQPEEAGYFMPDLRKFLLSQPFIATAVVIDREGYFSRYREQHVDKLWEMDKTAFSILVERAAKFADLNDRKLEIIFEESGRKEDRALIRYMKALKQDGNPFTGNGTNQYDPMSAKDFRNIILGEPRRKKKALPQLQVADLVLFPIAKGGYQPNYRPYKDLVASGKLIDDHLPNELRASCGIKYSCFE